VSQRNYTREIVHKIYDDHTGRFVNTSRGMHGHCERSIVNRVKKAS